MIIAKLEQPYNNNMSQYNNDSDDERELDFDTEICDEINDVDEIISGLFSKYKKNEMTEAEQICFENWCSNMRDLF